MSDYDEFKKVINGFEKSIEYECSDPGLINSIFKDIRDMVEAMVQKRDKELESKSSPKNKPKKECPPGKIVNPKTGRCINKPKEKTQNRRGRPKKTVVAEPEQMPSPKPMSSPKQEKSMSFDEALEYIRTTGKPGSYRKFLNGIKTKFGITLKYDNHGDDYAVPDLYFMKGKKECSIEEMKKVKQYVIDTAEKSKSPPVSK
jgi:hypothetical protein